MGRIGRLAQFLTIFVVVGASVTACFLEGLTAEPTATPEPTLVPLAELDLCSFLPRETDWPDGWVFEEQSRHSSLAQAINYCGMSYVGPSWGGDCGATIHMFAFSSTALAHKYFSPIVEGVQDKFLDVPNGASVDVTTFPISQIGDEAVNRKYTYAFGEEGFSAYRVVVRHGPFVYDLRLNSDNPFSVTDIQRVLRATETRLPDCYR